MLCQNCQQRTATVHLSQINNNAKVDVYLCQQCAGELANTSGFVSPFGFDDLISGLFGSPIMKEAPAKLVCKNCGMEYDEFLKSSRLGCAQCYKSFEEKLDPIIRRLHGNANHHGKVPVRVSSNIDIAKEIEKLKVLLNESVKREEYEEAAKIRDRIRSLEVEQ